MIFVVKKRTCTDGRVGSRQDSGAVWQLQVGAQCPKQTHFTQQSFSNHFGMRAVDKSFGTAHICLMPTRHSTKHDGEKGRPETLRLCSWCRLLARHLGTGTSSLSAGGRWILYGYGSKSLILQIDGFQLNMTILVGHLVP